MVRRWPQKGRRWKANGGKVETSEFQPGMSLGRSGQVKPRRVLGWPALSLRGLVKSPVFCAWATVNAPTEPLPITLQIDRLGTPGTTGAYPAFGRPDLVFGGGDQRCRMRKAGVIALRLFQHLVENLLRQVGEDEARVVRVEHLKAIDHYLIAGSRIRVEVIVFVYPDLRTVASAVNASDASSWFTMLIISSCLLANCVYNASKTLSPV